MIKIFSKYEKLKEILNRYNVKDWNRVQMQIWLKLVQDNVVKMDDMNKLFMFGQIFSDYFDKYGEIIPYDLVKKKLSEV